MQWKIGEYYRTKGDKKMYLVGLTTKDTPIFECDVHSLWQMYDKDGRHPANSIYDIVGEWVESEKYLPDTYWKYDILGLGKGILKITGSQLLSGKPWYIYDVISGNHVNGSFGIDSLTERSLKPFTGILPSSEPNLEQLLKNYGRLPDSNPPEGHTLYVLLEALVNKVKNL